MIQLDQACRQEALPASQSALFRRNAKMVTPLTPGRPRHLPSLDSALFGLNAEKETRRISHKLCALNTWRSAVLSQHASSLATTHHLPSYQSAGLLPTTAMATAVATPGVGFFKLLIAFIMGGLFFSTAIAAVSACYAVGLENVKLLWDVVKVVINTVWRSFTAALGAAKAALLFKDDAVKRSSWKWRSAWQVLKQELAKTRQTAAEGVQALRQEASLYAGAVGAPGLIPVQYLLDRFLPFSVSEALKKSLKESLAEMPKQTRSIQKIRLVSFSVGARPPQLQAARVYELGNQTVAYDVDVDWESELDLKLVVSTAAGLARIPVTVRNVNFQGVVRLLLTPLIPDPPGFGAALVSFPKAPKINLDVRVAGGDITRIPWLRAELVSAIQKAVADELLWPKRVVIPSTVPTWTGTGLKEKPILSREKLSQLEMSDPLLVREKELAESPMLRTQFEQPELSSLRRKFKVFVNPKENSSGDQSHGEDGLSVSSSSELNPSELPDAGASTENENDREQHGHAASIQSGVLWNTLMSYKKAKV